MMNPFALLSYLKPLQEIFNVILLKLPETINAGYRRRGKHRPCVCHLLQRIDELILAHLFPAPYRLSHVPVRRVGGFSKNVLKIH